MITIRELFAAIYKYFNSLATQAFAVASENYRN